jgi:hypothetical protein
VTQAIAAHSNRKAQKPFLMPHTAIKPYHNTVAVLTSMHAKERVMAPILRDGLGLIVELAIGVNTDRFGTFSREVERTGSQLDAAKAKIIAGFEYAPFARVALSSEGSFGPHPSIPFLPLGRELVLMVDRESGLELTGYDASAETNFGHAIAHDRNEAFAFAQLAKFPEHGLIVMGCKDEQPAPDLMLNKNITDAAALEAAVRDAVRICGAAFVETDMRAHRNPTRMAAIESATRDLVRRFHSRCPNCDYPGFDVTERITGLPCAWCGEPTRVVVAELLTCRSCGHRVERSATIDTAADPGQCGGCNP